ncbi:hypothetical protein BDF21DRAFT_350020, partial [Thamnidium elegans]
IVNRISTYQTRLQGLENEDHKIIGYVRKLPGKESAATRLRLFNNMVDKLTEASSVSDVYGSYSSRAYEPFAERDTGLNDRYYQLCRNHPS